MKWAQYFLDHLLKADTPYGEQDVLFQHSGLIDSLLANPKDAENGLQQEMGDCTDLAILHQLMSDLDSRTQREIQAGYLSLRSGSKVALLCEMYEGMKQKLVSAKSEEKESDAPQFFAFLSNYYDSRARDFYYGHAPEKKDIKLALAFYTKALKYNPKEVKVLLNRAEIYEEMDQYAEAIADYKKIIELDSKDTKILIRLAKLSQSNEAAKYYHRAADSLSEPNYYYKAATFYTDSALALQCYDQAIAQGEKNNLINHLWLDARANLHNSQGSTDLALADWARAIKLAPQFPDYYLARIQIFVAQKSYDTAIAEYDALIATKPLWAYQYYEQQAILHARQGSFNRAVQAYANSTNALFGRPLKPMRSIEVEVRALVYKASAAIYTIAGVLCRTGIMQYPEYGPIKFLNDAIAKDPSFTLAHLHRGQILEASKPNEAIEDFQTVRSCRNSLIQHKLYADLKLEQLIPEYKVNNHFRRDCVQQLTAELKEGKDQAENLFLLLKLALQINNVDKILEYGEKYLAVKQEPHPWYLIFASEHIPVMDKLWWVKLNEHIKHGRFDEAIAHIVDLDYQPKDAVLMPTLAYAHARKGDYKAAITAYDAALERQPKKAMLYYNRGVAKAYLGDYKNAFKDVDKAISLSKAAPVSQFFTARGVILMMQGKDEDAKKDFTQAIPNDPIARIYRGTLEDFVALRDGEEISGQMKFYAMLKLREKKQEVSEEDKEKFQNFKIVLQEKIDAKINVAENRCLLMLAEVQADRMQEAQVHYEVLMENAELQHIPFYLRRDFLEVPLVLDAKESKDATKQQFTALVDDFVPHKTNTLSQAALWRILRTTAKLESGVNKTVKNISEQLQTMTQRRPIDRASSEIENDEFLKLFLAKSYSKLFDRYEAAKPGTTFTDLDEVKKPSRSS